MSAEAPDRTCRCSICGKPRVQVGYTALNRPLLHCKTCDRRPGKKRRPRPSPT